MRKPLLLVIGLTVVVGHAGSVGSASAAPNAQTIKGSFLPKKLPKSKRAPIALVTDVAATNSGNPFALPNPTTLAKIDYDKDGGFQQKGLPTCDASQFDASTTTADAQGACGDAKLGGGSATIAIASATGAPPVILQAVVTAFNGPKKTLVLHTENEQSGGQVLIGTIGPSDNAAGSQFGFTVTIPVPPLAGGAAVITQFDTRVKKVYRHQGRKLSYTSARCRGDKKLRAQARFTDDRGQRATDTFVQKCKTKG